MAFGEHHEREMIDKTKMKLEFETDPLTKLRLHCLQRGYTGIRDFGRLFRVWDEDSERKLSFEKFDKGLKEFQVSLSPEETRHLFEAIDVDHLGYIVYDELLIALRPPMSAARIALIKAAFAKLDKGGDGIVTIEDLKGVYNVKHHPQFIDGEKTEDQILHEFLRVFESPDDDKGKVTLEEFEHYYAGVSASIDDDDYFDLMMRQAWKL